MSTKNLNNPPKKNTDMNPAVSIVKELIGQIGSVFDFLSTREKEKTTREAIKAEKEIIIAGIKAFIDRAKGEMDKEYDLRKYLFKELFPRLDKQLDYVNKCGDEKGIEQVNRLINSITTIATDSPLKYSQLKHFPLKQLGSSHKQLGGGDDDEI